MPLRRSAPRSILINNIENILRRFGIDATSLLGAGAEAQVFALNDGSVLRVHRTGTNEADVSSRISLLSRLHLGAENASFQIPRVSDFGFECGFHYTVEDRLSGRSMSDALPSYPASRREYLVQDYLETSAQLAGLLSDETEYGELASRNAIRHPSFKGYLFERATASLRISGLSVAPEDIIAAIEEPDRPALVHLDYYPSNVLCEDEKITAVLDFGGSTIAGSSVFNPIVAAAFLDPRITPAANEKDRLQANDWIQHRGRCETNDAVRKWLAVYWSFCRENEDKQLFRWCRETLQIS